MKRHLYEFGRQVQNRISTWLKTRRDIAELYALDDESLADIGITRADIPYAVYRRRSDRRCRSAGVRNLASKRPLHSAGPVMVESSKRK